MAETGQLVQWNDDRGFGFIEGSDGRRHFVHISAIGRIATRPCIGDRVKFLPGLGTDGRPQAKGVRILGANPVGMASARRRGGTSTGLDWRLAGVLLLLVLLATGALLDRLPWALLAGYAAISVVSITAYRLDKSFAETGQWRISEGTLLGLDLCLGLVGGLLGQALFRHKTRKPRYVAATALILAAHLLWLAAFASGLIDADIIARSMASLLASGAQLGG